MHEWSNRGNLISSWAPWHWFRCFILASSLALVHKNTLIHGTASSEEGEAPLPSAQSLCCVSWRNLLMKHGTNIPPRGQVLQGSAAQCCVVTPAPSAQAKSIMSMLQHGIWGKKPCTFSIAVGPSVSPKSMGFWQWLLGMRCSSCLYTFPGRSWVSKLRLLGLESFSSHPGGFIASGSFGNKLNQDSVSGLSPGAMQHCFQTTEQFCRWLLNMQRKLNDSFEYP